MTPVRALLEQSIKYFSPDNEIITEEVDEYHEKLDGGFVKPADESKN